MHHCVFMHWRNTPFMTVRTSTLQGTETIIIFIIILQRSLGCSTSAAPRECSPNYERSRGGVQNDW